MSKKERQSNIELLRVLAIVGVVILHYNNPTIGGVEICRTRKRQFLHVVFP